MTYAFRDAKHVKFARSGKQPLTRGPENTIIKRCSMGANEHLPRRQVVVLVREAGRTALSLDANERRVRLVHVDDVLMQTLNSCTVDDATSMEYARADKLAAFEPEAFCVAKYVVRARTAEKVNTIDTKPRTEMGRTDLCRVVIPYARNVSNSQERAGYRLSNPFQCA